jgi:hypothetical protein
VRCIKPTPDFVYYTFSAAKKPESGSSSSSNVQWTKTLAETDSRCGEEHCLVWALRQALSPRIQDSDIEAFLSLLRDVFPQAAGVQLRMAEEDKTQKEKEDVVSNTIRQVLKEDGLMEIQELVDKVKIMQLFFFKTKAAQFQLQQVRVLSSFWVLCHALFR